MREILFRGKRVDNGEWVEGSLLTNVFTRCGQDVFYILCPQEAVYNDFEDFSEGNGIFEVIPKTVGQYTGLMDQGGDKIFEDDIVDADENYYIVSWDEAKFVLESNNIMFWIGQAGCDLLAVGNIFDNPDMADW